MRPRVFPAEDAAPAPVAAPLSPGFNEAAGIPRGRHVHARVRVHVHSELQ